MHIDFVAYLDCEFSICGYEYTKTPSSDLAFGNAASGIMDARPRRRLDRSTDIMLPVLRLSRPEEEFPFACLHLAMGVILRAWQVQRLDKRDGPDTSA